MSLHPSSRACSILALCAAAWLAAPVTAQRTVPPAPATYDVQLRYSIRAGINQRIEQFRAMTKYLESIGFQRLPSDDPNEAADMTAERLRGTLASDRVRELLREPHMRTVLLVPAGMALTADPEKRVLVQLELESRLSPSRQRDLANQARARLAGIGFVEKVGYDHQGNVRLLGTMPAGEVETLVRDLRDTPSGWLAPDVPREQLPEPIRDVNPIRIVEVLAEPAGVSASADVAQPVATDSTLEKLPVDLRDADAAEVLRLDVILARAPTIADRGWRELFARPGVTIEGRLGQVVSIRGPAGVAKELVAFTEVAGVRRAAAATRQPPVPHSGTTVNAWGLSGLGRLHALGARGRGVRVAVIDSDFRGAPARVGNAFPKSTTFIDFTAARNADIVPDPPPAGDDIGAGTRAALAVRLAAPECDLVLIRIDPAAAYMLADVASYLHGDLIRSENIAARNRDLLADNEALRILRRQVNDEQAALALDFSQDEATIERRKKLAEKMAELVAKEKQYLDRLTRFTQLEEDLANLRLVNVVVNGLAWDVGYPVDGSGPLSQYLDGVLFAPRSGHRAIGPAYWFQLAGDTRGQSWNGSLADSDGNGAFEFAEPGMPLPVERWTRELNFLGWVPAEGGNRVADLPAGAKMRVAVQWTETHDSQADASDGTDPYRTPIVNLQIIVLRQRDPSGAKVASDDFNVIARSARLPQMIERTPTMATYEAIVEFTVESAGRYALRLEGIVPPTIRPAGAPTVPAQNRRWEPRARVFVEASGATNGRPVIADFPSMFGGLGTPGDAIVPRTVGAANSRRVAQPYSAAGPSAGRDMLTKPTFIAFDELPLPGGVSSGGTGCAAGFAGGLAASMLSAGAPPGSELHWLGIPPGGLLVVPDVWLDQLSRRVPSRRP
jgi:hypothetical protein